MDSKRKVSHIFNSNPKDSILWGPKNRGWNCIQTDINKCKIKIGKRGQEKELTVRGPMRRWRLALDCSAI